MNRISKEELLETLFHDDYEHLKGKVSAYDASARTRAEEVCLAHIITPSDPCIYQNLGLHIGTHAGEDHTGDAIAWYASRRGRLLWLRLISR